MSPKLVAIQSFLNSRGAEFISAIRFNEVAGTVFLEVPLDRVALTSSSGITSARQITFLSRAIEERFDIKVIAAFKESPHHSDVELGIRAIIARRFPEVTDFRLSFSTLDTASGWVTLSQGVSDSYKKDLEDHINSLLSEAKVVCQGLDFLSPSLPEPSTVAILRTIKICAPVDLTGIIADLQKRSLACPSERWLSARLDSARKRGLLTRSHKGDYSLTSTGLQAVPHSRSKSSSDIDRILALARRKEW